MSKHTPGPWEHIGQGHIHGHEANGGGVDIARVYLREDQSKWQANASLIAAAPELAEALQMWARWNDMTEADLAFALQATNAVLAKALPQ